MHIKKEQTAYHEAGHVVAKFVFRLHFTEVSILPGEGDLGHVTITNVMGYDTTDGRVRRRLAREIIISCYAGAEAELTYSPKAKDGGSADRQKVFELSREYGVFPRNNDYVGSQYHMEYLEKLRREARKLVKKHWPAVQIVAEELLKCEKLDQEQINTLRQKLFPSQ